MVQFAMHRSEDIHIQVRGKISRASYKTPRNLASYLNVNIFGTMHRKLNHLWTSIDTGPLYTYAKSASTILHNQGDTAF